jgi:predicted MFS family arabinose efflux permease
MPVSIPARFVALASCGCSAFIDMYATQPLLPEFRHVFGASEAAVGLTVTATSFGCAAAAPLVGSLADSIGRKRVIVTAIIVLALVTFGAATATTLPALIAWRAAQGALMPGVFAVTLAYIAEDFPASVAGSAVAAYVTGNVLGGFLGRYVSANVAAHAPWQAVFLVLGALNLIGVSYVFVALPRSQNFVRSPLSFASSGRAMLGFLRDPQVVVTYLMGGTVLFTLVAAFTFVTFHLADAPFRLSTAAIGNVFIVYLLGLVSTPLGGRMIDRLGNRGATLVALVASIAGLLLTLVPNVPAIVIGLAVMSSGVFVMQTSSQGYLGRIVHANRSTASAVYFTFYYVGGGLGAVVPAFAYTRGGWGATVALIVALQVAVGALAFFGWRARSARAATAPVRV